jgi:hypothetical protein
MLFSALVYVSDNFDGVTSLSLVVHPTVACDAVGAKAYIDTLHSRTAFHGRSNRFGSRRA